MTITYFSSKSLAFFHKIPSFFVQLYRIKYLSIKQRETTRLRHGPREIIYKDPKCYVLFIEKDIK
jgi:hypothetical protein